MKAFLTTFLSICAFYSSSFAQVEAIHHAKFRAMQLAKPSLVGNNPMILREDWWQGKITTKEAKLVQQHLFKGNSYQFWLALEQNNTPVKLDIYNRHGDLLTTESIKFEQAHLASIKFSPPSTGMYFLRIALGKNAKRHSQWALIYAYQP